MKSKNSHSVRKVLSRSASVNYVKEMTEKPSFHAYNAADDRMDLDSRTVDIANARDPASSFTLDENGFSVFDFPSKVADFHDMDTVSDGYPKELEQFILEVTGARRAIVSTVGGLRSCDPSDPNRPPVCRPVQFVHTDFSDLSAWWWASQFLSETECKEAKKNRFAIYNVWRSVTKPPQDYPLAVCDSRYVTPNDYVICDAVSDFPGDDVIRWDATLFRFNRAHKWYFFEDLSTDEAIVFKAFESDKQKANRVPHTAFADNLCPSSALPRESIEARVFVFF